MNKADAMAAITITKMTLRNMQHLFSFMHAHKANSATRPKMTKPMTPMIIKALNPPMVLEAGLSPI